MGHPGFDATITLNDHHLAAAGLSDKPGEAVAAVRQAVQCMDGAGWIDVEAHYFPPTLPGWVILYARGQSVMPETAEWRNLAESRRDCDRGAVGCWVAVMKTRK
jgi:hypothetical protein